MRKFNTKLPQQNPILCNLEEIIRQRIHGKPFLQERIFAEVAIDMRNVRRLLGLTDGVKQCSGGSLQKCRRALRTSTQPGIQSCLQFQVHLHDHNRNFIIGIRIWSLASHWILLPWSFPNDFHRTHFQFYPHGRIKQKKALKILISMDSLQGGFMPSCRQTTSVEIIEMNNQGSQKGGI